MENERIAELENELRRIDAQCDDCLPFGRYTLCEGCPAFKEVISIERELEKLKG